MKLPFPLPSAYRAAYHAKQGRDRYGRTLAYVYTESG